MQIMLIFIVGGIALFILYKVLDREKMAMDEEARKDAPGSFVALSKGVTHYEIRGQRNSNAIVLIHGISLPSYSWSTFADDIAAGGYRVITYDLYGRGYSDRPNTTYNSELYTEQLYDLLNALHCKEKVSVLGISMGGGVATHFVSRYPEKVEKMILMTPLNNSNLFATLMTIPPIGELLLTFFAARKLIKLQQKFADDYNLPEGWADKYAWQMNFFGYKRSILSSVRHFAREDHISALKKIATQKTPTLLIWGEEDTIVPFSGNIAVRNAIPDATFLPLAGIGHLIPIEKPDVLQNVLAFLPDSH
ncbi:alpha/beta hydrolase [bacterium]|nr:alpha/beta hydrolase [bacterium]